MLAPPEPQLGDDEAASRPWRRQGPGNGQARLEIAAAGGHNLLMIGPPGSGKSMLAQRLPGLLPPLSRRKRWRSAWSIRSRACWSRAACCDGGRSATRTTRRSGGAGRRRPAGATGRGALAHLGVLFLDELPEFPRPALEALRQPLETGRTIVARANAHVTYPARVQLVAAMNPCRCGWLDDAARACARAPSCAADYQARISGPLLDRIDLTVEVPAVHRPIWRCRRQPSGPPKSPGAWRPRAPCSASAMRGR